MNLQDDMAGVLASVYDQGAKQRAPWSLPNRDSAFVLKDGEKLHVVQFEEERLLRIRQKVTLHDLESFIDYVTTFKTESTRIFGEPGFVAGGHASITAALDYHGAPDMPEHVEHRAYYQPRYSEQWERWNKVCREPISQEFLAEFIEETQRDIVEPTAAELMDIVRFFKASKAVNYDSAVYTKDGTIKVNYSEEVLQEKRIKGANPEIGLPEKFKIGIPVYFRDGRYPVNVFVRFQVVPKGVVFKLKLDRPDVIEDDAFDHLTKKVTDATKLKVLTGRL
jgi:uncharacterized protein YfdQ (DUF2303 family)